MRKHFLISQPIIYLLIYLASEFLHYKLSVLILLALPITLIGFYDIFQTKHTILRNFPLLGHARYLLELIRPEIQQYFIERYNDGKPFSREQRSVVYQRAKNVQDTSPFGTQRDVYQAGAQWLEHSMEVCEQLNIKDRVLVGGKNCKKPYSCSRFNISAMSFGSLSKNAISALNKGAKLGGFYHNTGEGGISPHHQVHGGDLVWQIGTAYFGCRNADGTLNEEIFQAKACLDQVKMIEIKLSQGAKPGHGGILPAQKVTHEIAEIRGVEIGTTIVSPPGHKAFKTPRGLLEFVQRLRELSGGKPVGFKLCLGKHEEFIAICKAMVEMDIHPDFITVDGSEGGTGAAPREFANHLGTPLGDALNFVHNTLLACEMRKDIKLIASGKVIDAFDMVINFSLGADIINCGRGMMFAIGCIQALRCNTNQCPSGVATQDPHLYKLLNVQDKGQRVANYHKNTLKQMHELVSAAGVSKISQLDKKYIKMRQAPGKIISYAEIYPSMQKGDFLNGKAPERYQQMWNRATLDAFYIQ